MIRPSQKERNNYSIYVTNAPPSKYNPAKPVGLLFFYPQTTVLARVCLRIKENIDAQHCRIALRRQETCGAKRCSLQCNDLHLLSGTLFNAAVFKLIYFIKLFSELQNVYFSSNFAIFFTFYIQTYIMYKYSSYNERKRGRL